MPKQPVVTLKIELAYVRTVILSRETYSFYAVRSVKETIPDHYTQDGLMTDVTYEGDSIEMFCAGKTSHGDAVGHYVGRTRRYLEELKSDDYQMPDDVTYSAPLAYDNERRCFHIKGHPTFVVTSSDYLLLPKLIGPKAGHPIFGWKVKPEGAPDLSNV